MSNKIVVDTSVFISALIGPSGPSRELIRRCLNGHYQPLMGNALFCEYESVPTRLNIVAQCPLTQTDMATLTIRLPDDKHERLKAFAQSRGVSVNKLVEELSTIALTEFDTFTRFKAMAAKDDPQVGLQLLNKLDTSLESDAEESTARR